MSEIVEDLKITNLETTSKLGFVMSAEDSNITHTGTGELKITSLGSIEIKTTDAGNDIRIITQENDSVVIPHNLNAGTVCQAYDPQSEPTEPYALLVPTGAVIPFAGSATPGGWLLCNGALQSASVYPTLYAAIGTTYGGYTDGEGTWFNVPDLRSRLPLGAGDGTGLTVRTLAATGGQEVITEVPPHTHGLTNGTSVVRATGGGDDIDVGAAGGIGGGNTVSEITVNNTGTNITSPSVNVMNPFLVLNYIIKV
jgi:microcystin-dependent protein